MQNNIIKQQNQQQTAAVASVTVTCLQQHVTEKDRYCGLFYSSILNPQQLPCQFLCSEILKSELSGSFVHCFPLALFLVPHPYQTLLKSYYSTKPEGPSSAQRIQGLAVQQCPFQTMQCYCCLCLLGTSHANIL